MFGWFKSKAPLSELSSISASLREILEYPNPCIGRRPFVCDGKPESCTVMVIGENPALPLDVDWWEFWSDDSGFDLRAFNARFQQRQAGGKTFEAFERLLEPFRNAGHKCLVTNAYRNENAGG